MFWVQNLSWIFSVFILWFFQKSSFCWLTVQTDGQEDYFLHDLVLLDGFTFVSNPVMVHVLD